MPSLPARQSPVVPPDAPAQRLTIDALGRLFATQEARAKHGVTIARRGKPAGVAPRDMVIERGGHTWRLKKGDGLPVTEFQEVRGLCFRGARVAVYYQGGQVYDIVRVNGSFEVHMESLATWYEVQGEAEVEVRW